MNDDREELSKESGVKTGSPKWSVQAFKDFMDYQARFRQVLELSRRGIHMATQGPMIIEVLAKVDGSTEDPNVTKDLERAQSNADFAQREIDNDFPVLHAQAVVSLWGSLETLVLTVVADWIVNRPEILHQEPWRSLKVKVGEYETLDTEQKASHLASSIDQSMSGPLKGGVTRFESLIETIGLKGGVSEEVRRGLWELQQTRNVIVHKRGKADRKFCEACPWLGLVPGTEICVTSQTFDNYYVTAQKYVVELIYRTGEFFGVTNMRVNSSEEIVSGS
jgi:hypothetical protein